MFGLPKIPMRFRVLCYRPRDEYCAAGTEILDPRGGTEELGVSVGRER